MSKQIDEAVKNLNDFLLEHPELQQEQFMLMAQMEGLSTEDRMSFLLDKIKQNIRLIVEKQQELTKDVENLKTKLKNLDK